MLVKARRRYTEEFKIEAVRLVRESPTPWLRWRGLWGDSRERVVSVAHPAPTGRDPWHDTGDATCRSRRTHAGEAGVGAGDPGAGLFTTCGGVLREGVPKKYRVIREYSCRYPIRLMCRALAVSPAGY